MTHGNQLNSSLATELRVKPEYVDGEGHLVSDALSGTVAAGKEFEVGGVVVLPVPINVVDSLVLQQGASKFLGHNVSVFKDAVLLAGDVRGDRNPQVSVALNVSLVFSPVKSIRRSLLLPLLLACRTAIFLHTVEDGPSGSTSGEKLSAVGARYGVFSVGGLLSPSIRALHVAVHRVFTVFLAVCVNKPEFHREDVATELASEWYRSFVRGWSSVSGLMKSKACLTAKSFGLFSLTRNLELVTALLANLVDRHIQSPVRALQNRTHYGMFGYDGQLI